MSDSSKPFGQWLTATMQSRGLSQAAVAREVGVADAQVSRWRRGQVTPSVRHLQRMATAFEVPRAKLELMAGYPVEEVTDIDPALEAVIEACQARFRRVMEECIPPELWQTYTDGCEALAERLSASFEEVTGSTEEAIKNRSGRQVGFRTRGGTE